MSEEKVPRGEHAFGDWSCMALSPDLIVVSSGEPRLFSAGIEARVDTIWAGAKAARPALFNGRVFCADRVTPERIEGHWTDYRHALAQIEDPLIFGDRPLRQLAVCGGLRCSGGFVIARRAPLSLYLGGFWQSPPAGTVESRDGCDDISLADQIAAEAGEEIGLTRDELEIGHPLIAVTHMATQIVDIGIPLTTRLSFDEIRRRWSTKGNREYDQLALIADGESSAWRGREDILPTTRRLFEVL
ncbi:phosphohydrolase [Acetobacter fallax]|uniref:Phosphohydrolase n=1 Tax=Acetobacter fallax TaxID=1737473 RepID=A0ABX0K4E4_9PROT|nr:phosphohydrolase [Acetobacter fallax]NHO31222.1 phosphohydrolase [Acetobacter fallax]NHO34779.1 phosphohydrolase [Acetobacter fallax]